jgi:hypothetical protein
MYGYYQNRITCIPVTSIEEVKTSQVNFDGSISVFTDITHGKIYTKQLDLNGLACINVYELAVASEKDLEKRVEELEEIVRGIQYERNADNELHADGNEE